MFSLPKPESILLRRHSTLLYGADTAYLQDARGCQLFSRLGYVQKYVMATKIIWKLPFNNKAFQTLFVLAETANISLSYFFFRHEKAHKMKGKLDLFKVLSKPRNLTCTAVTHKSFRSLLLWENRYILTRATFQICFVRQNLQTYASKNNQVMTWKLD